VPISISDLKYAARLVLKGPWFTLLTILVLAGELALSIYTFAIVNTMIYKDLPLADGHSIVRIGAAKPLDEGLPFDLGQRTGLVERRSEPGPARPHRVV
jgi:hypothetical protein